MRISITYTIIEKCIGITYTVAGNEQYQWRENMVKASKRKASAKYDAENTKMVSVKLNRNTDRDILEQIARVNNVSQYLKSLIRKDIAESKLL